MVIQAVEEVFDGSLIGAILNLAAVVNDRNFVRMLIEHLRLMLDVVLEVELGFSQHGPMPLIARISGIHRGWFVREGVRRLTHVGLQCFQPTEIKHTSANWRVLWFRLFWAA